MNSNSKPSESQLKNVIAWPDRAPVRTEVTALIPMNARQAHYAAKIAALGRVPKQKLGRVPKQKQPSLPFGHS